MLKFVRLSERLNAEAEKFRIVQKRRQHRALHRGHMSEMNQKQLNA